MFSEQFGTADDYYRAFSTLLREGIHDNHLALLRAHYAAPEHTATWQQLAEAVGYARGAAVNMQYGTLAKRVASEMRIREAPEGFWLGVLVDTIPASDEASGHMTFVLRRPVIEALQRLAVISVRPSVDADPESVLRQLVPSEHWPEILAVVANSIDLVHWANPSGWAFGLSSRHVELAIGPHPVLQIGPWALPFQLVFDSGSAPDEVEDLEGVAFSLDEDRYGNPNSPGYYTSGPGSEACGMPFEVVSEGYALLLRAHTAIIAQAGQGEVDPDIPHMHVPELVDFIAEQVGRPLPQPAYVER